MSAAVRPADCVNETSFDYTFCNSFVVTPTTRTSWTLTVRVSFVASFYSMHWTRYGPKAARVVSAVPIDLAETAKKVHEALIAQGFAELPGEWQDEPVPGVVLELAGASGVTLSKCLFEDYE